MIKALIFDFDGLIVDTESCIFRTWQELYGEYGQTLKFSDWAKCIGASDQEFHPLNNLKELVGAPLDENKIRQREKKRIYELVANQPILPGVKEKLAEAKRFGLKTGVASSSPHIWVDTHLQRLGLIGYFDTIRCKDDVENPKPSPALFNLVLKDLHISPNEAIVFEDSPNGIMAARRAGIYCVAIPNRLTKNLSMEQANKNLQSLAHITLAELIAEVENDKR